MPPKSNPMKLNPLQLRTLTLLQAIANIPGGAARCAQGNREAEVKYIDLITDRDKRTSTIDG